jgi:murein DD-endopeptidase MepM/ murein hydrolase activator NlpD
MTIFIRHPVDNPSISQPFANNNGREATNHLGVDYRPDYPGQVGKVLYAPADMFIVWARGQTFAADNPWDQLPNNGNNGNSVIGAHPAPNQAVCTMYCHMDQIWVKEGQFVRAGEPLGTMGWTGYIIPNDPNGTHLHWEMFIDYANGVYPEGTFYGRVNPLDYFATETTVPVSPGAEGESSVGAPQLLIPELVDIYLP